MGEGDPGDVNVGDWLADLSSASATPGGGAAAAVAGACGAALIAMTARLTLGKKGFENVQGRMEDIVTQADAGRLAFLELARKDVAGFDEVLVAFRMPKETEAEKTARSAAIQAGYATAAEAPLEVARLAVELLPAAEETARAGDPAAASDACSAAAMLAAASIAAAANVRINAAALHDERLAAKLRSDCEALEAAAEDSLARTRQVFLERIDT